MSGVPGRSTVQGQRVVSKTEAMGYPSLELRRAFAKGLTRSIPTFDFGFEKK